MTICERMKTWKLCRVAQYFT